MGAATETSKIYDFVHIPGVEAVQLTATDGETYTSKKFKKIYGAVVCSNYDTDAHINATISGQTVTINWAGQTDQLCTLMIFGAK